MLVFGCVFVFSSCSGTQKVLLFENRVYHWKVFFVKKNHLSIGTYHHFEVFYKDRQLILPKEITDGRHEVSEFVAATAIDNRSSQFGIVIVCFEAEFVREDNVSYRTFVTLHIRQGKGDELAVTNPCSGKEILFK